MTLHEICQKYGITSLEAHAKRAELRERGENAERKREWLAWRARHEELKTK